MKKPAFNLHSPVLKERFQNFNPPPPSTQLQGTLMLVVNSVRGTLEKTLRYALSHPPLSGRIKCCADSRWV